GLYLALIYAVSKILLPPVLAVLEERVRRIDGVRQAAKELEVEAAEKKKSYEEIMVAAKKRGAVAREARIKDARAVEQELMKATRQDAAKLIEAARERISRESEVARAELDEVLGPLSRDLAGRLLERPIS
ncbi:MAG: ATP synthase F0 subunit B, partial [Vicinamibacteria bacterium]